MDDGRRRKKPSTHLLLQYQVILFDTIRYTETGHDLCRGRRRPHTQELLGRPRPPVSCSLLVTTHRYFVRACDVAPAQMETLPKQRLINDASSHIIDDRFSLTGDLLLDPPEQSQALSHASLSARSSVPSRNGPHGGTGRHDMDTQTSARWQWQHRQK